MARPKQDGSERPAKERIAEAFWQLLEEKPYAALTVRELSARAGVNKNAFYYHYETLDILAKELVEESMPRELISGVIRRVIGDASESPAVLSDPGLPELIRRLSLAAGDNGAPLLGSMLKSTIREEWCAQLGVKCDALGEGERLALEIALGGMMAAIAFWQENGAGSGPEALAGSEYEAVIHNEVVPPLLRFISRNAGGVDAGEYPVGYQLPE